MLIVDKAVVENASGKNKLLTSVRYTCKEILFKPHIFFRRKEYKWILLVYGATYMAANSIDSLCKHYKMDVTRYKLFGVTAVNMSLSILKDRAFA